MDLVRENNLDMLVLAEYLNDIDYLCAKINSPSKKYYPIQGFGGCDKIKCILFNQYQHEVLREDSRYMVVSIGNVICKMNFTFLHAESKLNSDDFDRQATYYRIIKDIQEIENATKTKNTIIIGDFNASPYEHNLINANTLHAIPYKEEIKVLTRRISGIDYEKFYNPMWRLLGKKEPPYGTYYLNTSRHINYFWHIFDQVIFRPAILKGFVEESLKIIYKTNKYSLLKNNYKPDECFSDHLPIFFRIREENLK